MVKSREPDSKKWAAWLRPPSRLYKSKLLLSFLFWWNNVEDYWVDLLLAKKPLLLWSLKVLLRVANGLLFLNLTNWLFGLAMTGGGFLTNKTLLFLKFLINILLISSFKSFNLLNEFSNVVSSTFSVNGGGLDTIYLMDSSSWLSVEVSLLLLFGYLFIKSKLVVLFSMLIFSDIPLVRKLGTDEEFLSMDWFSFIISPPWMFKRLLDNLLLISNRIRLFCLIRRSGKSFLYGDNLSITSLTVWSILSFSYFYLFKLSCKRIKASKSLV